MMTYTVSTIRRAETLIVLSQVNAETNFDIALIAGEKLKRMRRTEQEKERDNINEYRNLKIKRQSMVFSVRCKKTVESCATPRRTGD
jgi:hypothetical protein